jgi:hypothetical protein
MIPHSHPLHLVAHHPLLQALNLLRAVSPHHRVRHKLLLAPHQINLLRKVVAVNPEQEKLKQQVKATAKQALAWVML